MANCPYCGEEYWEYTIVGVRPADEHLNQWLDPMPLAQLFCESCGRYTFMHPDHPDVQRLRKGQHQERQTETVRTLNVPITEIGDDELREQFARGRD
ncbi:MAG TPA: hypothetical protein VFB58_08240 [Chloroflexota bacterium]|nr:hypothetical protein [Chloroflexota bacterium]